MDKRTPVIQIIKTTKCTIPKQQTEYTLYRRSAKRRNGIGESRYMAIDDSSEGFGRDTDSDDKLEKRLS